MIEQNLARFGILKKIVDIQLTAALAAPSALLPHCAGRLMTFKKGYVPLVAVSFV